MIFLRAIATVLFLTSITFNSHAQDIDYHKLSAQNKADLARYLGWVWGDGRPGPDGKGILYKGGNSNYSAVVSRLVRIKIDGVPNPFGFPGSGNRKLTHVWDYWENALPGGNPGDPEILREAIKHPNFLAGIIEGEGQIFHSNPNRDFVIDDQSYAPSHPEKFYDMANFGPERVIQLFHLLDETYGFSNPAMSIRDTKYQYDTQRCEVIERIRALYKERKKRNESGDLQPPFTVKVYVKPPYFDEIRNYGYFKKGDGKYRTPAPDSLLNIIQTSVPDQNTEADGTTTFFDDNEIAGTRFLHGSGNYMSSTLDMVSVGNNDAVNWNLIELDNGFYRIESQDTTTPNKWLQAVNNTTVRMADESSTWHFTQWEKIPVPNTNDRYYIKNRFHETYLRVGTSDSMLKHGARGPAAQWELENVTACID